MEVGKLDVSQIEDRACIDGLSGLTREQQIIELASQGRTDKDIAAALGIRPTTVATYWSRVRNRYGVSSRSEAVAVVLNEAAKNFRLIIEMNPDGVFVCASGILIYANPAGAALMGFQNGVELVGKATLQFFAECHHARIAERLERAAQGLSNPNEVFEIISKGGAKRWVEVVSGPTTWEGKPTTLSICRDRTREFEAERELQQRVASLEVLVGGLPDLIFVMSADGYFLEILESQNTQALFPPEVILGKHYRAVMPEALWDSIDLAFSELLATGSVQSFSYELPVDGSLEKFDAKLTRTTDGNVLVVVRQLG
ncbi:MAG: PAS domain S-box protein [Fimbriimonadaceae bacterium]